MDEKSQKPADLQVTKRRGNEKIAKLGKRFEKGHKPDPIKVSQGMKKKFALKDMLQIATGAKFNDAQRVNFQKAASLYFGVEPEMVTIEMMMEYRQIEKAINKSDTYAYNSVKEWAYGSPKQLIQQQFVDENGNPIKPDPLNPATNRLTVEIITRKVEDAGS